MSYAPPSLSDFKARFDRDFAFAVDQTDRSKVRDVDITRASTQVGINFNENLWSSQEAYAEAMLLLTAHFLCANLLSSSQGLGALASWLTNSKAVGNITESFAIPQRIANSPFLAGLSKTLYGQTYLSLILPQLTGNVACVQGDTTP